MRRNHFRYLNALLTLGVSAAAGLLLGQLAIASPDPTVTRPVFFEENRGQAESSVRFLTQGPTVGLKLGEGAVELTAAGRSWSVRPAGGTLSRPRAEQPEPGLVHYLDGPQNVPTWGEVVYPQVYPGVNLKFSGPQAFRWEVGAGADERQLALNFEGSHPRLDREGNLHLDDVTFAAPVGARYELRGGGTVGFAVPRRSRGQRLVVEVPAPSPAPEQVRGDFLLGADCVMKLEGGAMAYTTHVNGRVFDLAPGGGRPCLVGRSATGRALITRLQESGRSALYRSELGQGEALAVALDDEGNAYATGLTADPDFPVRRAFQPSLAKASDAFVVKLDPSGALIYSTYLGGQGDDSGRCIAVDALGNAYVGGTTGSADFPTVDALQPKLAVAGDGFVAKLSPTGSTLSYATYLGGSGSDSVNALAVDEQGQAFAVGTTESPDFPTSLGAHQTERPGGQDVFLTRLNPTGSGLVFSTYLGAPARQDRGTGVALHGEQVTVSGEGLGSAVLNRDGELLY